MTVTFPLPRGEFADLLAYAQAKIWRDYQQEISGDGNGVVYPADIGPSLWRGQITLGDILTHEEAEDIEAIIDSLDGSMNSFFMPDPRRLYPRSDPGGAIIRSWSTPIVITDIRDNNKEFKLNHLPPRYSLSRGDRCHFNFGSNPVHRSYHRLMNSVRADAATGATDWIEVRPHLVDGAVDVGTQVTFDRPAPQWFIPPKTRDPGTGRGRLTPGGSFTIQQVL